MTGHDPAGEDPFREFDAAYVLGALSPEDRFAFEQHLRMCADCARSVRELAGMPGLLAQARTETVPVEPPPAHLLPALTGKVRRARRRTLVGTVTAAVVGIAAGAAAVAALVLPVAPEEPAGVAMTPVSRYAVPVQATARLTNLEWGSKVEMSCTYRAGNGGDYALVAVRRDGGLAELASWHAVAEDTVRISVGTRLQDDDIQALEIRTPEGKPLLRMTP
ncbi:anti-sigma factor family protein [Amycolatopsis cihanbeyliensis]|uniref:Putative zinc finger protein n=1 Tax=Amycolatopsis cihanbeyliensis TaxID=1128664 RepID=A0A542CT17_AMYCI|nr:zf-HC2 domain-containing protein [Amycolatopsis cihanbeyliensis]TQI93963.1 putative zinc finger protein [Amycolatopsis cihanbeyliensis]